MVHKKSVINQIAKWIFIFGLIISLAYFGREYYYNNIIHADAVTTVYKNSQPKIVKKLNQRLMKFHKTGRVF